MKTGDQVVLSSVGQRYYKNRQPDLIIKEGIIKKYHHTLWYEDDVLDIDWGDGQTYRVKRDHVKYNKYPLNGRTIEDML